jgi:hypothetical protein
MFKNMPERVRGAREREALTIKWRRDFRASLTTGERVARNCAEGRGQAGGKPWLADRRR